jgi:periplasmic nitrate reductase NapE
MAAANHFVRPAGNHRHSVRIYIVKIHICWHGKTELPAFAVRPRQAVPGARPSAPSSDRIFGDLHTMDDRQLPATRAQELRAFLFLTVVTAPILSVAVVGGYGFFIWMYQLMTGSLPSG